MDTVNLQVAVSLILVAGLHIGEESAKGFRMFLNTRWFDGTEDCPLQHLLFSVKTRSYTPGLATTSLYLGYLLYFMFLGPLRSLGALDWLAWAALAVGAVFIPGNYFSAALKVRKGGCETVAVA